MIPDSHAHLDLIEEDTTEVLARARDAGVGPVLTVGINHESNLSAMRIAEAHEGVYASAGVHPNDTANWRADEVEPLRDDALSSPRVVALGETGLDYYRERSPEDKQKDAFRAHIGLARELGLPVIVHDREAHRDVMEILGREAEGIDVVLHCFSGDGDMLAECVKRGYYISFAGPITFKKPEIARELAASVPDERLLVETDAPFLTPVPHRGKPNEPSYVRYVAQKLAEVRGQEVEGISDMLAANFERLFLK